MERFYEKKVLKNPANSKENDCVEVSFLIMLQAATLQREEVPASKNFKNAFFSQCTSGQLLL